jgi:carbon-monoxide dehydrogenase large subunit
VLGKRTAYVAGESGVAGSLPAALNAMLDALARRRIRELDLPMLPAWVWSALERAGRAG